MHSLWERGYIQLIFLVQVPFPSCFYLHSMVLTSTFHAPKAGMESSPCSPYTAQTPLRSTRL